MPEGPELRWMAEHINQHARNGQRIYSRISKSALALNPRKHPDVELPASWNSRFTISAESRGKELKIHLSHPTRTQEPKITLLVRAGMSGNFIFKKAGEEFEKHAHLRFEDEESDEALCYTDYRRFGSWQLTSEWGPPSERGPCIMQEFDLFVQNLKGHYEDDYFKKPICEIMLDQQYFSGIGNYLRAEILHRAKIHPFTPARSVLEPIFACMFHLFVISCQNFFVAEPPCTPSMDSCAWAFFHNSPSELATL
eukprot:m.788293 g.788293  ORF g.788293 m.788293 type:complete len:253 (+) comp59192_c1_seq12:96-854(+)